ncbi:MAG: hypothetical protein KIS67_14320 [Verrucomicrobiae bacterium]|nr:hypothetical protein [Verrucomicrobiae bacterium]
MQKRAPETAMLLGPPVPRRGPQASASAPAEPPAEQRKTEGGESNLVLLSVRALLGVPIRHGEDENTSAVVQQIIASLASIGGVRAFAVEEAGAAMASATGCACSVCGWVHDSSFTQIKPDTGEAISLGGVLPYILALVHTAHEKGLNGLSSKDATLLNICGGYRHPCKAFDDLNQRAAYKRLFDTRRRGFIALRGAVGKSRNKSEFNPE